MYISYNLFRSFESNIPVDLMDFSFALQCQNDSNENHKKLGIHEFLFN